MKIQGRDLVMGERICSKCHRPYRAWIESKQVYCSNFCKEIVAIEINGTYQWAESDYMVKRGRPKANMS